MAEGGHMALKGWDSERPWALVAKARMAVEGAFRPSPLVDLAELVNRTKHTADLTPSGREARRRAIDRSRQPASSSSSRW